MKNIAYIELDTHAEILLNFWEVMKDSDQFSVDYYVTEKIQKLTSIQQNLNICNAENIVEKLTKKHYDLVIIGTAHRYFSTFLEIEKHFRTAVVVHNINFSTLPTSQIVKNISKEDVIYRTKLLLKEGLTKVSEVYEKAAYLLVLDREMLQKTDNAFYIKRKKENRVYFLPIFSCDEKPKHPAESTIVVIPGGVSQQRRDYEHVFSCLKNTNTFENFSFIFLGKATGKELQQLKNLKTKLPANIQLEYFEEKVSSELFKKKMQSASVLWCPIQEKTSFFSQTEIYGKTKMTGNLGDAIRFGKPAIFPKSYSTNLPFIFHEEEDIFAQILALKSFNYDFSQEYSRKHILHNLENILKTLT